MPDIPELTRTHSPDKAPDPQGQAALLLVESLLHELVDNAVLSLEQGIAVVDSAIDVKILKVLDHDEPRAVLRQSLGYLEAIAASLRTDAAF